MTLQKALALRSRSWKNAARIANRYPVKVKQRVFWKWMRLNKVCNIELHNRGLIKDGQLI